MKVKDIIKAVEPQWLPNTDYNSISPKVTVVLPTFRRAKSGHFEKAVESVIAQKYTNWELIIVDDASVDGTFDLIKFYMELDSRINCIRHTHNLGLPAISEYEAYIKARGEYIAYIFDDNIWDENHLLLSMKAMVKHNVKFTYGIARSYDKELNYVDIGLSLDYLPFTNGFGNGAVVIHKDIIDTVGLYDPHVTLTRVCDWDLWLRISHKYVMHKIDAVVTYEYGAGLNDSLGNTVPMNPWVCKEQMSYSRNDRLIPQNFPEYEINTINPESTALFREFTGKYYHKYINKCWFAPDNCDASKTDIIKAMKRVLLILPVMDATYYMSLSNISCNIVTMVTTYNSLSENHFIYADIVIFYRNIDAALKYIPLCRDMNVTSYYYTDDNFAELAKEKDCSKDEAYSLNEIAKHYNRKDMGKFDGVLVSTENLKSYLEDHRMNDNTIVLPPCVDIRGEISPFDNDMITVGFMGGKFREKIFADKIYPALVKLSEIKPVRLVCTETLISCIKENYRKTENITFVEIKRDTCYDQVICKFRKEKVNILIHSGEKNRNNKFKTLNSLINAIQIGAVLITSEVEPYTGNNAIVNAKNDVNSWFEALKEYSCNEKKLREQYKIGYDYVCEHYSQDIASSILSEFISRVRLSENTDLINRYETVLLNMGVPKTQQINTIHEIMTFNNEFIDKLLSFAAVTSRTDVYTIKPEVYSFSKIGFIISSDFNDYEGILKADIYIKNRLVASSEMNMADIVIRQMNYFDFGSVIKSTGKIKIKLSAMYSGANNSTVGVYLVAGKKSLPYKVLKKAVGINLPITNLIYFDLK